MDAKVIAELGRLRRADEGLVKAYDHAAGRVDDERLGQELRRIGRDHREQARNLELLMRKQGSWPVEPPSEPEPLARALARLPRARGGEVVGLLADAERAADAEYGAALQMDLDADGRRVVQEASERERDHVRSLEAEAQGRRGTWGREGTDIRWGTSGYGTGDQFGGGESGGAGGFPSAGPSYSGGESDFNTGE